MIHKMKLANKPFEMIKSGEKTIELRLYDEKRQQLKIGDEIEFVNLATLEKMVCGISNIYVFRSFDELYKSLPLLKCGYTKDDIQNADPKDMDAYYSEEEQKLYGAVGIELSGRNIL